MYLLIALDFVFTHTAPFRSYRPSPGEYQEALHRGDTGAELCATLAVLWFTSLAFALTLGLNAKGSLLNPHPKANMIKCAGDSVRAKQ